MIRRFNIGLDLDETRAPPEKLVENYVKQNCAFIDFKRYSNMTKALRIDPMAIEKKAKRQNLHSLIAKIKDTRDELCVSDSESLSSHRDSLFESPRLNEDYTQTKVNLVKFKAPLKTKRCTT